jgi:hypothetical protein
MIKLLDINNANEFRNLMEQIDTIMGQDLNAYNPLTDQTRRESFIQYVIQQRFQQTANHTDSLTRRNIGWYHEGELKAVLFQDFSTSIKAWTISFYFSTCKSLLGRRAGGECLDWALAEAERLEYYEYYRVIELSKYKAFDRYATSKLRHRYMLVLDEIVPAHERSVSGLVWDWLFEGNAKDVDVAVVKGILKQEYRSMPDGIV